MNLDHGESPFSGGGLALSGSFFLPPKIPKIFCKAFFFFCPLASLASAGGAGAVPAWTCPGSIGFPSAPICGGFGCPPPKICDSHDPFVTAALPPCNSQSCVGAEPVT